VCNHLFRQTGRNVEFSRAMWKFNMMQNQELREMAASDVAAADLVIIALNGEGDLPEELKTWIALWQEQRRDGAKALMLMSDGHDDSFDGFASNWLPPADDRLCSRSRS